MFPAFDKLSKDTLLLFRDTQHQSGVKEKKNKGENKVAVDKQSYVHLKIQNQSGLGEKMTLLCDP